LFPYRRKNIEVIQVLGYALSFESKYHSLPALEDNFFYSLNVCSLHLREANLPPVLSK
jgi:hypothetical protein